jgi:phenylacetate-CoA ligase
MHPVIARSVYFALQWMRREPIRAALEDVRRTEFLSLEELRRLQAERLLAQIRFARQHVPHYRRTYQPWAAEIASASGFEQAAALLRELPVIAKGTVVGQEADFAAECAGLRTHPDKTSGSSGTPLIFPCDQWAWAYRHALMFRMMEAFGIRIGDRYAQFFGLHWDKRARREVAFRDRLFNRVRISAYEIEPNKVEEHFRTIERHRPAYFFGYPSAIADFCTLLCERGMDLSHLGLKAVVLTAEPLRPHQRALIEQVTSSRCVNLYGSAEGGTTAFECPSGSLHVAAEAVWVEESSGADSYGVLVTDMMLRAFPLIRYSIEDEIVFEKEACPCGRAHPVLHSVEGRSGEAILLPNGRRVNANLPSYILKPLTPLQAVRKYRFVHSPQGLVLQIVATNRFKSEHIQLLTGELHAAFGHDVAVRIQLVDALPHLPNAKHRDYVNVGP